MPNPQLGILVVDDAKFSSVMIGRALNKAGYQDVRFASSAEDALRQLAERPTHVLLADWLMPETDGLQLTARVRELDGHSGHYTYVILLTGRDGVDELARAFDQGVDDFISKAAMHEQLLPRVLAADRLCGSLQRLKQENRQLASDVAMLERHNLTDPLTGLGNRRCLEQRLAATLRQLERRETALCYLHIGLQNGTQLRAELGAAQHDELLQALARRLQQLVRPLDTLVRLDDRHFGVLAQVDSSRGCSPGSFKRLHEGLNLKAFRTREGFVSVKAGIVLLTLDASGLPASAPELLRQADALLPSAYSAGRIVPLHLRQPA
ncbi:response regulator [Pseudomonas oligotrophica]|uniref:response regulator n=1 Tax=Pseudomonas oligotrophica TaxID=2912055 RepID=UPI001F000C74|nr:response regulator [Pseudomonas oligotrophica]MCF7201906.1 response regulator [Pseudomonas oligotrophica]